MERVSGEENLKTSLYESEFVELDGFCVLFITTKFLIRIVFAFKMAHISLRVNRYLKSAARSTVHSFNGECR